MQLSLACSLYHRIGAVYACVKIELLGASRSVKRLQYLVVK